jgi:hypothetical protein
MTHRHLTEEQLIAHSATGRPPVEIATCEVCRERHQSMSRTLDEVARTATLAADAAFPPERLARQRARILARVERCGQRARILAFPQSRASRVTARPRPFRRWIAGAAAAGVVVGLVAGRTVHDIPALHVAPLNRPSADAAILRASSDALGDDELLREVESAVASAGPSALRRIEDVTPAAWDGDPQ